MRMNARAVAAGFSFVLVLTAIQAVQRYRLSAVTGGQMTWFDAVFSALPQWVFLVLVTPLVIAFVNRFPLSGAAALRNALIHLATSLSFGYVTVQIGIAFVTLLQKHMPPLSTRLMMLYLPWYALTYWGLLAVAHAIRYHRDSVERERAAAELRQMLLGTRLDALRARMNPHFLFNTLNTISTLALQNRSADVVQATGLLGELLRVALDESMPQEIPLSREADFTARYIAIQQIRFGERLAFDARIDAAARNALVPSLLLQPLVENSVVHALAASTRSLQVGLSARTAGGRLRIEITDDGSGPPPAPRDGVGLGTTRERLRALYGAAQSLEVSARDGGGTIVTVELPLRERT